MKIARLTVIDARLGPKLPSLRTPEGTSASEAVSRAGFLFGDQVAMIAWSDLRELVVAAAGEDGWRQIEEASKCTNWLR